MKPVLIMLAGWLLVAGVAAQNPETAKTAPSTPPGPGRLTELPAGTVLAAELTKGIDSRKAKQGDAVYARTTQDMLANGRVVIPHDSKLAGHITEAEGRPKGQKGDANSTIGIVFDRLMIKGGPELPVHASIQAIAKPLVTAPPISGTGISTGGYGGVSGGGGYPGQSPGGQGPPSLPGNAPSGAPPASNEPPEAGGPQNSPGFPAAISVQSQGVIGMKGYSLSSDDDRSLISSTTENVKLEGGTQLILKAKEK